MSNPLRYCKAFTEAQLAAFSHFAEIRARAGDGAASQPEQALYLHEDLRIRAGMFPDNPLVFETEDPAWVRFCTEELAFPPAWISDLRTEIS